MESAGNHISLMFASVYNQISTQKILTTILFKIVLNKITEIILRDKSKEYFKFNVNLSDEKVYSVRRV